MDFMNGKQEHPGWALRTKDGCWMSFAHGWHIAEDAFYAKIFKTEEDAIYHLKDMQGDFRNGIDCDVVPAWEPLCGQLRHEVKMLTQANKVSPDDILEVSWELESVLSRLKGITK
jgi:hypothetical protein